MKDSRTDRIHRHFVTGKLAAHALQMTVEEIAKKQGFDYSIGVMPITVAALMTPRWLARHLVVPSEATEVILPGYVGAELDDIRQLTNATVTLGPRDLRDLEEFICGKKRLPLQLLDYDIEIIAEINHAPRLSSRELLRQAALLRDAGADRIDVGCEPGYQWMEVGTAVAALVADGHTVSIDSFDEVEVELACQHGASLVLSVNSENASLAHQWGTEVVAIPDSPRELDSLYRTIQVLEDTGVSYRLDPILEPIGMGLADSIVRYHTVRQRYPKAQLMMGIGNLTELTDVDSAGVNMVLLGMCAEWNIRSVLTTQVIPWASTSVRECDLARRLVHYAVTHHVPPKRLDDRLVVLRDPKLQPYPPGMFEHLAATIRDNNYRIFAQDEELHLVSAGIHLHAADPFLLFDSLLSDPRSSNVDVTHAFYLGFELAKAQVALQLGKQYNQDQALHWGHLTIAENLHRLPRSSPRK